MVTGIFPPDIGGPAIFTFEFSKFLEENKHNVEIITLADSLNSDRKTDINVKRISRNLRILRHLKVIYWALRMGRNADLILVTGLYEEMGVASFFLRKKIIMRIVGDPVWERAKNRGRTKKTIDEFNRGSGAPIIQRHLLTRAINRSAMIVTPSVQLQNLMVDWGIYKPIHIIPNGTKIPSTNINLQSYRAVTVSRLVAWKNIDLAIKIAHNCDFELRIIGDGPLEEELQNTKNNRNVSFLGRKTQEEVNLLLNQSNIFILLSTYEGQSFALTEALAHGMFCIVSNIPGNIQLVSHLKNGFVIDLDDIENSTFELLSLLKTPKVIKEISERARIFAINELDSAKTMNRLMEVTLK